MLIHLKCGLDCCKYLTKNKRIKMSCVIFINYLQAYVSYLNDCFYLS